ncbi:putative oxidoreductase [Xylariaceae sp. FL1019]|nr:putative oxidoreductase [Xylariaceae sp. FL1019]
MAPQLIFGTASFGMPKTEFQDAEAVKSLLKTVKELGITRLDTGARYPPTNPGRSEELLGESQCSGFIIDTKVLADTATDGSGELTTEAIVRSANASLKRLQKESVNVLHIHRADPATPLEEQIRGLVDQIAQGHCKEWGVSNVQVPMLEEMLKICERNGWQKPSCYQGVYNLVSRGMEAKLLPLLRKHGIAFNCFQSLAAGFLTGNFVNDKQEGTRFGSDHPLGAVARNFFGGEDLISAMKMFDTAVKAQGFTPIEVAIRWIAYHSSLTDDDGIVVGASKPSQIIDLVGFYHKGSLPDSILPLVDELWNGVKDTRGEIL